MGSLYGMNYLSLSLSSSVDVLVNYKAAAVLSEGGNKLFNLNVTFPDESFFYVDQKMIHWI